MCCFEGTRLATPRLTVTIPGRCFRVKQRERLDLTLYLQGGFQCVRPARIRQQHDEFLAAVARDQVAPPCPYAGKRIQAAVTGQVCPLLTMPRADRVSGTLCRNYFKPDDGNDKA